MKSLFLSLVLALAPVLCFSQEAQIPTVNISARSGVLDGPTEGSVGQRIEIQVLGLPPLDLEKPLKESLAWLDTMQFKLDAVPGDVAKLEGQVSLDVISRQWKLVLWFTPRLHGSYVVVFVSRSDLTITTHRIQILPFVPPEPTPTPLPDNPLPQSGLRVLILEEQQERHLLPKSQNLLLASLQTGTSLVAQYLNSKTAKDSAGHSEWRFLDDDTPFLPNSIWRVPAGVKRREYQTGQMQDKSLPWIVISNGMFWTSQPLPATEEALLTLLKQYGG